MVAKFKIDPARPLIICDADEVLLQFIVGLERYFHRQGLYLDLTSFRIHGNVRDQNSHAIVPNEDVTRLIEKFFVTETEKLEAVPGAAAALAELNTVAQIVVLSNVPTSSRGARAANLHGHAMPYPVVAGSGPKGTFVRDLIKDMTAPIVFIDDLPPHHTSVATETPHVKRLHFVADPRLAKLIGPSQDAHARIDTWPEAAIWIHQALKTG